MKVLFIKQLFYPEPTAKSIDLASELVRRGHEVQVLTGYPSYPLGRIYEGYKQRLWSKERMNGVEVIRVPIYPDHSGNSFKRILHYISYAASASLLGPFLVQKPDVAFVYQGAIPVGIPAAVFKYLRGVPFVYDINDLWPETVFVSGMIKNKSLLNLIGKWCKLNYRIADHITVATPGFHNNLVTLKGVPKEKITFVPNWSRDDHNDEKLEEELRKKYFPSQKLNILYAGNLGIVQSLDTLIHAARSFQERELDSVNFILLGGGADEKRLKRLTQDLDLNNVTFIPRVASNEVSKYLYAADILFVHLKNTGLFKITIPSKILSYLNAKKPILMGLKGDAAAIIEDSGSGLLFEPENVDDLIKKIEIYLEMETEERRRMGQKGIQYYQENLSLKSSTDRLEKCFKKIAK